MTRPARIAIGATAAALGAEAIGGPPTLAISAMALAIVVVGSTFRSEAARRLAGWIPAIAGAGLIAVRIALAGPAAPALPIPAGSGPWQAVVESVGSPKAGTRPAVLAIDDPPGLRVAATLPWYPEVAPGDRVRIGGSIEPPPDGSYGDYLRRIGASGTLQARTLALESGTSGDGWEMLRRASATALDRSIPAPEAGLAEGIIVGLRDRVDRDLAAAFTTAGVSHIVAISGWNIAIVATTLGALTGRLGRRRRTIATGVAILAYVAFVGPSPSVVRAAAMAGCAMLARELGRPTSAIAAMGLAVTGLLLIDPSYVDDAGFRLSVLATAGLIAWGSRLARRLAGPSPGRARSWLAESLGVSLAAQAATLPVILLDFGRLSLVSPAVNLLVAPFVAPAMAAGGGALLVGLGVGAGVPAGIATLAGLPAWLLLGVIVGTVRFGAGLPFASISLDPPANVVGAAIAALVVWAIVRRVGRVPADPASASDAGVTGHRSVLRPRSPAPAAIAATMAAAPATATARLATLRRLTAGLLSAAVLAVVITTIHRPDGATRITVLDVGQGDAILLEGGSGGRLLIDGGPDPGRLLVVLDELLPPWDRRLDAVVLTHPHEDHVGGLALLLARYRVGRVFEPGMIGPGPGYAAWNAELTGNGTAGGLTTGGSAGGTTAGAGAGAGGSSTAGDAPTRWALGTGDRLAVDDVALQVLWPDPGAVPLHPADSGTSINNVSIVLLGAVAGHRFLLAGDIEQGIDPTLLARGLPTVDFLKVAHHGSGTASTQAFLDAVRPKVAAVSVGAGNPYGHPAPATIARLRGVAGQVYRTDLDGSVTVTFDGPVMRVHASGGRPAAATGGAAGSVAVARPAGTIPGAPSAAAARGLQAAVALFACAVPLRPLTSADRLPASIPVATRVTSLSLRHPPVQAGWASGLLYHRPDDGTLPRGDGPPPPLPRPAGLAPSALARRRRGRGLARPADPAHECRPPAGSKAGRGSGAPARRRQGPSARGSPHGRPPRRGGGGLAGIGRTPGAVRARVAPSGHRARDGIRRSGAREGLDRGPDRGLRRQARPAAHGLDGGAIRPLDAAPSGRLESRGRCRGVGAGTDAGDRDLRSCRLRARGRPPPGVDRPDDRPRSRRARAGGVSSHSDSTHGDSTGRDATARDPQGRDAQGEIGRVTPPARAAAVASAPLAYYWGDDGYGIEAAVEAMRRDAGRFPEGMPERARIQIEAGNPRAGLAELGERVATGVLFGSGVLAVVSGVGNATRRGTDRDALLAALATVAPGNGVAIAEETDSATREAPGKAIVEAVRAAGGEIRRFEAPREGGLAAWLEARGRERGVPLGPGAARELATRVGGYVREGDVDRRQQGRLAVMELEKLSLRHGDGGVVTVDDVRDLVAEAVPGTMWGFVDAVGMRQRTRSLELLERLLDEKPEPVLLAVLHRRVRELIEVADRLASGETPGSLVRSMRLQPFRAEILVRQAAGWSLPELEAALEGLLELDALVKGVGGRAADPARQRLAFDLWITDLVAPA